MLGANQKPAARNEQRIKAVLMNIMEMNREDQKFYFLWCDVIINMLENVGCNSHLICCTCFHLVNLSATYFYLIQWIIQLLSSLTLILQISIHWDLTGYLSAHCSIFITAFLQQLVVQPRSALTADVPLLMSFILEWDNSLSQPEFVAILLVVEFSWDFITC